ncbi:MAG: helix-turn-helix domain-containing protein [Pseudonocardiaceae bacterium]
MSGLSDERRRMAEALRRLRAQAGLSTTQLAHRLGWSQSKVSKTERGVTLPQPSDVEAWAIATGASRKLQAELGLLADRSTVEFIERRRVLAPGRRRVQEEIQRLEQAASVVRVFQPDVVVGLAQTRNYVAAMYRLGQNIPAENLDDAVTARLARQATLADQSKRFELIMGEAALRRRLIPPEPMRAQLERLIELSLRPNIFLGVIRFDAHEIVHQYEGFSVIGDPDLDDEVIAGTSTVTRTLRIRGEAEIREYIEHFTALRAAATEGEPLRALLEQLIAELSES